MRDWSYSRLQLYENCPAAFKLRYIEELPEQRNEELAFGSLAHRVFAEYTRQCMARKLETDVTAMDAIVEGLFYADPRDVVSSDRYAEMLDLARSFAASHTVGLATLAGVEEWIEAYVGDGRYLFRGIIDRLDFDFANEMAIITDYKTDWQVRSQSEVERDFQLAVYAWLVSREYPNMFREYRVRLDFVRWNVVREAVLRPGDLERVEGQILRLIMRAEADREFAPRPGHFCSWCGYAFRCPAVKSLPAEVRAIRDAEEARRVAAELAVLERQVAMRKEALKAWCKVAGPVEANGVTWGFFKSDSVGIADVDSFVSAMNELGLDPRPYLAVSAAPLKRLLADERAAEALKGLLVDRSRTEFRSRKGENGGADQPAGA